MHAVRNRRCAQQGLAEHARPVQPDLTGDNAAVEVEYPAQFDLGATARPDRTGNITAKLGAAHATHPAEESRLVVQQLTHQLVDLACI